MRVFATFVGLCETNAYLAYKFTVEDIPRYHFREKLSYQLTHWDGKIAGPSRPLSDPEAHAVLVTSSHGNKCIVCGDKTKVRCKCGAAVCNPVRKASPSAGKVTRLVCCYYTHLKEGREPAKKRRVAPAEELTPVVLSQE